MPLADFYTDRQPTTAERKNHYSLEAPPIATKASEIALQNSAVLSGEITHLITVSCTGFFAPGLDIELINRLGLRRNVQRSRIGFMGCHAAINALSMAQAIVRGDPASVVLVCCVELCSLHFNYRFVPSQLIASALFGVEAAAAVVGEGAMSGHQSGWNLIRAESVMLPDTRDDMTWRIGDHGFEMTLSPRVPSLIESKLREWCVQWLGEQNLSLDEISHWAIHPGGPKVLDAAQRVLNLSPIELRWSRDVLRDHGNLSSVTLLRILAKMASEDVRGKCVALGFGPGLVLEGFLLER